MKNFEIEFLRLMFSIGVVFYHFRNMTEGSYRIFKSGYIAVDFFFIVSGYFMMKTIQKAINMQTVESGKTTLGSESLDFVKKRLKSLFPYYLSSLAIAYTVHHLLNPNLRNSGITGGVRDLKTVVFEALLLKESGLGQSEFNYNGVTWYLSVMIIVFMILYPFIRKYKDTAVKIILPLVCVLLGGYMYKTQPAIQVSKWQGIVNWTLIRGIIDISFGCIIYAVANYLKNIRLTAVSRVICTILSVGLWTYIFGCSFSGYDKRYDFFMIFVVGIAVMITLSEISYSNCLFSKIPLLSKCRDISLLIYLNHKAAYWILFYGKYNWSSPEYIAVYLILTVLLAMLSVMLQRIVSFAVKKSKRLFVSQE